MMAEDRGVLAGGGNRDTYEADASAFPHIAIVQTRVSARPKASDVFNPPISVQALASKKSSGSQITVQSLLAGTVIASVDLRAFDSAGKQQPSVHIDGNGTGIITMNRTEVARGDSVTVQALIREISGTNRTAVSRATAPVLWRPDVVLSIGSLPSSATVGVPLTLPFSVSERNGDSGAAGVLVVRDGAQVIGERAVAVTAGGTQSVPVNVTVSVAGDSTLTADVEQISPADDDVPNNSVSFVLTVRPAVIDARQVWKWRETYYASRHLAILGDGQILVETWQNGSFPLLDPASGTRGLLGVNPYVAPTGVAPNPVVFVDANTSYVAGAWNSLSLYREDGFLQWQWTNVYGCCNGFGYPNLAVDRQRRRVLASFGNRVYMLPVDAGPVLTNADAPVMDSGPAGRGNSGAIAGAESSAYVAGSGAWINKWDISTTPATLQWTRQICSNCDEVGLGAVASDGSFAVTNGGFHNSPYWDWAWHAGDLYWIAADGSSSWSAPALAITPPVIGPSGLIYVGALASPGAPQHQLDGSGVVRAFDQSGREVWTVGTSGLPQDLLVGDDGNVYVVTSGTQEGRILALDQTTGSNRLTIEHVPAPWEIILQNGVVYAAGDLGETAIPLPSGYAFNYDPQSPWPVRQHDNQRTGIR